VSLAEDFVKSLIREPHTVLLEDQGRTVADEQPVNFQRFENDQVTGTALFGPFPTGIRADTAVIFKDGREVDRRPFSLNTGQDTPVVGYELTIRVRQEG